MPARPRGGEAARLGQSGLKFGAPPQLIVVRRGHPSMVTHQSCDHRPTTIVPTQRVGAVLIERVGQQSNPASAWDADRSRHTLSFARSHTLLCAATDTGDGSSVSAGPHPELPG